MRSYPIEEDRLDEFVSLSWTIHREDRLWIPPLKASLVAELAGRNTFGRYGRIQPFLCEGEGGAVLGRAAAILNPRLEDAAGAPLGQIGYFEAVDDERVARSVVEAALAWLRERGARSAIGPMNGGAHRRHRLMVRGFDRTPFLLEPRNPPYYPRLFEACGFERRHGWRSYELGLPEVDELLRLLRGHIERARRHARGHYRAERLEPRAVAPARIFPLLDSAWAGHVGYGSLELDEFAEVFSGLLALVTSRQVGTVKDERTGRDLGLAFMYPDFADEVRALAGDASGWGSWMGKGPLPRRLILHTTALLPEARRSIASSVLVEEGLTNAIEDGFTEFVFALVTEEENWHRLFERIVAPTREYALYERAL